MPALLVVTFPGIDLSPEKNILTDKIISQKPGIDILTGLETKSHVDQSEVEFSKQACAMVVGSFHLSEPMGVNNFKPML